VIFSVVCLLARCLLGCLTVRVRREVSKDAGLLVLRHENAVLRRNAGRVRYEPGDQASFATLTLFIPRHRWAGVFSGDARDAAGLAPQARRQEIRHDEAAQARPALLRNHPAGTVDPRGPGAGPTWLVL
jgi:hypothetical protein